MGISHEYHSTHGRRRRSKAGTGLRLAGVIAAILLLSLAITAILENGEKQSEAVQQSPAAGTAANILAPLPMQGDTGASAADSAGGNPWKMSFPFFKIAIRSQSCSATLRTWVEKSTLLPSLAWLRMASFKS